MRQGRNREAGEVRNQIARIDPLDPRGFRNALELVSIFREFPDEGLEAAVSCLNGGLNREAEILLDQMPVQSPIAAYYRGWLAAKQNQEATARAHFERAAKFPLTRVFPFQFEAIDVLREAIRLRPEDSRPHYYLGLFLFDRQRDEAMKLFARAAQLDPSLAIARRNLAFGYALNGQVPEAIAELEQAIRLNPDDALYLFELDQLMEWAQRPAAARLALFRQHAATAAKRDDAMARYAALLVENGHYDEAIALLEKRRFHLWEGGVRFNAHDPWTTAHIERGRQRLAAGDAQAALADFLRAVDYPPNLETVRSYRGSRAPEALYYAGLAYEALGQIEQARQAWRESAASLTGTEDEPRPAVGAGAVLLYFPGRSLEKLNDARRARQVYQALVKAGDDALKPAAGGAFFAKFGDRQPPQMRRAQAYYVRGLGRLGLGARPAARRDFAEAVKLNVYLQRATAGL
jgi:tetratricopeptide (TPR) repeat protein